MLSNYIINTYKYVYEVLELMKSIECIWGFVCVIVCVCSAQ